MNETLLFTPAALLDLLSSIDELKDVDVGITETFDGNLQLQVGDSFYEIDKQDATDINVEPQVVDTIDDVNTTAYEELDGDYEVYDEYSSDVEGGPIKEVLKTLLIGGMVRLGSKMLKN